MKKKKAPVVASLAAAAPEAVEFVPPHNTTAQQRRQPFERCVRILTPPFVPNLWGQRYWLETRIPRARRVDAVTVELACLDCDEVAIVDLRHGRLWCASCDLFGNVADILAERGWPVGPFGGAHG